MFVVLVLCILSTMTLMSAHVRRTSQEESKMDMYIILELQFSQNYNTFDKN
jgi:Na+-transporting methylmalonyl-CoA/oxaloacetate decarboxylase gamma subunit